MSLKRSKRNKFVLVAVILFLFLSLVSAILLTQRSQEVRKEAATSPPQDLPKENYPIEKDFFQDHPLTINQPIYSLSLDADINFKSKKSFIRFILIDSNKNEYLVYETYPLIAEDNSFSIEGACEETCVLEKTVPVSLRIEGYNTVFNIKNTSFIDNPEKLGPLVQKLGITKERERLKAEKDNLKIQRLNEGIKKNGLKWIAGETLVSKLSYAEKKKSFIKPDKSPVDRLPNLQGFEFYKEGVFEIQSDETKPKAASTSNLPRSWDWRKVHGENWMTPRKAQGSASTCGYFATVGAIEALINLYYNQHLDVDLSEQMLIDCPESNSLPLGMGGAFYPECYACYPGYLLCVAGNRGLVTEECDPYLMQSGSGDLCSEDHICSTWRNKLWKFSDFHDYKFATDPYHITGCSKQTMNTSEEELKRLLIQKGPMSSAYINHGMVLTGYETDPLDGNTIWIFKDSRGDYLRIKPDTLDDLLWASLPIGPVTPPPGETYPIACVDKDGDGYCNWGISEEKPASCISPCRPEKDCDDSNPNLGPFAADLNCTPISPTPTPTITPPPNSCWGIGESCDPECNKSFVSLRTAYASCNASPCYCGWMDANGNRCDQRRYSAYYSQPDCAGRIVGYTLGEACSSDGTGTCYNWSGAVSGEFQSRLFPGIDLCVNTTGSGQFAANIYPCTWRGSCFSYSIANPEAKHSGSGDCSMSGSGNCYKLIGGASYYTKGANCGKSGCSSDTFYSGYSQCNWITVSSTPTPTPKTTITIENVLITSGYDPCYSKSNERIVFFIIRTTPGNPNIKRVWVKRVGGGWIARDNSIADQPRTKDTWIPNFDPSCQNDSHPWIITNYPDGNYKVKAVALNYYDGTIAESDEINVNISYHPTSTPTLTCIPNGGTVSDCSFCCSTHCQTSPFGPSICIP